MSSIARWSYANTATVRPFLGMDGWTGAATYGDSYEIACNWIAASEQSRDQEGHEFTSKHIIYTEDPRPGYLDMITLPGISEEQQVRSKTSWEMAAFNDTPDYKLVT